MLIIGERFRAVYRRNPKHRRDRKRKDERANVQWTVEEPLRSQITERKLTDMRKVVVVTAGVLNYVPSGFVTYNIVKAVTM